MNIYFHQDYKKAYQRRISKNLKLRQKTLERIKLFQKNPDNPSLKDHPLKGARMGLRAFSITGDIRIVYLPVSKGKVIFLDVGSHNQVY